VARDSVPNAFYGPLLLAREFGVTLGFYRETLGLPVEGAAPYAKCLSESSRFSIVDGRWWAQVNGSENPIQGESSVSNCLLMIRVADVEEVFRRLMAAGTLFLSPPSIRRQLGERNAFLRDPDGRCVMLTSTLE
jgi:hypothetical protein